MNWLRRALAPQHRSWVIYFFVLLPLLIGAHYYKGSFDRRQLTRLASSARRVLADKDELPKLKMERSSLEFQLPNLRNKYPILTNSTLARDWSATATLSQLDPDVCESWRAYLDRVSPLVAQRNPDLQPFVALQEGYENAVERLARDAFAKNKTARFLNLRTNQFAALFGQPDYVAASHRFDEAAGKIADAQTIALRAAYRAAVVSSVTNLTPKLQTYAQATLDLGTDCDALRQRLAQLDEKLAGLDEGLEQAPAQAAQSDGPLNVQHLATMQTFATWLPQQRDFFTFELGVAILGFVITMPLELRDRRWVKILASVLLIHFGLLALRVPMNVSDISSTNSVFSFFGYLVPAVLLAALWTSDITFFFSKALLQLVDSSGPAETELTSLRPAYRAAQQGDPRGALRLLKPKLLMEPTNYEALVFKARLLRQLNRKWRTKWTLKRILRNPRLEDGQREHALDLLRNLDGPALPCWQPELSSAIRTPLPQEDLGEFGRGRAGGNPETPQTEASPSPLRKG
ncbi:membrane hypothetical protein [Verrucomicrobia bacterium]|nr:membrane hypothetical protein [Verrucomicrobiota bacterium]